MRQNGQENKTKKQRLCFRAIHQIPSQYSKPRYVKGFHTSFIKYCGLAACAQMGFLPVGHPCEEGPRIRQKGLVVKGLCQEDGRMGWKDCN